MGSFSVNSIFSYSKWGRIYYINAQRYKKLFGYVLLLNGYMFMLCYKI